MEVARSSGYQLDLVSELSVYLTGVENVSELLARTADKCKIEDVKQVCRSWFSVILKSHNLLQGFCIHAISSVRYVEYP